MKMIIVGGGLAGAHAAEELRKLGPEDEITLISAESHLPYERPPLSKGILLGSSEPEGAFVHDAPWYADNRVTLRLGAAVTSIDTSARLVKIGSEELSYDRLLLATGSTPRHLAALDDSELNTLYLRTIDDALTLKAQLNGKVLIVGAGWIGLEVAAAAREAGAEVTVVEAASLPLQRVIGDELGTTIAELHRSHGVDLRLSTSIAEIDGHDVILSDGKRLTPDVVVVGIGASPNTELAQAAGLDTANGIVVDAHLQSSDPDVFAAGDVASQNHPDFGQLRVEHWDNAIEQGKHAARAMHGDTTPYSRKPYFFTDQYDWGMEYYGHAAAGDVDEVIVRRTPGSNLITALWVK
ncbi:MAG TPA: FAD-dependent oxidoreductase, partial [Marmoricola sp.]|nr:FAD-dependent oxidoreductase [Marmoricola sp.]